MHRSEDVISKIRSILPAFTIVICLLQPLLDVLSYWQIQLGFSNFSLGIRVLLIGLMLFAALPLVRNRKLLLFYTAAIILFLAGHAAVCIKLNTAYQWREDLFEHARFLMLPITTYCFLVFLRANEKVFGALRTGIVLAFCLMLAVMVLSAVTGTDPHTYENKELGIRGWFFWTSAQSAIISMICPMTVSWTLDRFSGKLAPLALACLLSFGALFAFGTRLSYASIVGVGACLGLGILIADRKRWRQSLTILLCAAVFVALIPLSPMLRNRSALQDNMQIKQERVTAAAEKEAEQIGSDLTEAVKQHDLQVLAAAYRYNLQGMIDRFGIERVASAYDYTLDAERIFDNRTRKLIFTRLLMEESQRVTPLAALFGLELDRTRTAETEIYVFESDEWVVQAESSDPENDIYGIYYLGGLIGFSMLLLFLGYFAWLGLKLLRSGPKNAFAPTPLSFLSAFVIALVYSLITVSVLRRNNASFYLAAILACIYDLSRTKRSCNAKEELMS